jgi:sugar fermentation stimulation protein A
MKFTFKAQSATFLARPNRFRVEAKLHEADEVISAHCADPGRLRELLIPGVTIHVNKASNPNRKTGYDLRFVEHPEHGQLISLDTRLPNQVFADGLTANFFEPFRGAQSIRAEVSLPEHEPGSVRSRIDFLITDRDGQPCWIEVKSVTLVEDRVARFPDAPTERGRRHLEELTALTITGVRTAVVFIIQRPDADRFEPNIGTDPDFARALRAARQAGVEIYAYTCRLSTKEIVLDREIAVELIDLDRMSTDAKAP